MNRPYICGRDEVTIPTCDDCSELEGRVTALEEGLDECCTEVKGTLEEHTESISQLDNAVLSIQQTIGSLTGLRTEVVDTLPEEGEPNVIYLVPNGSTYTMWLYSDDAWRKIGGGVDQFITQEDLTTALASYITTTQLNTALSAKQDVLQAYRGIRIENNSIERVPLIGEIVEVSSNNAPQYYGSYELVDKNLKYRYLSNEGVTWSSAATNRNSALCMLDKGVDIRLQFDAKVTDDDMRICRIPYATLGLNGAPNQHVVGYCDGNHQVGMFRASTDGTDLIIDAVDAVPHSGYVKETWHVQFHMMIGLSNISNDACDRFYFKRIS